MEITIYHFFYILCRRHWIGPRHFECKCNRLENWINGDWISAVWTKRWRIYSWHKNGRVTILLLNATRKSNWHSNEMSLFSCWTLQEYSTIASSRSAAGTFRAVSNNVTPERRYKCWNGTTSRFHHRNLSTKFGTIRCNIRFYIGATRVSTAFLHQTFWW